MDIPEAVFWAKRFEYPNDQLPFCVTYEMERMESGMKDVSIHDEDECWDNDVTPVQAPRNDVTPVTLNKSGEDWDSSNGDDSGSPARCSEYLEMDVPLDQIVFVDDRAKFVQFNEEIRKEVKTG